MIGFAVAVSAGYGVYLVYTAVALGWRGLRVGPPRKGPPPRARIAERLRRRAAAAGLPAVPPAELGAAMGVLFLVGAALAFAMFGGLVAALATGAFASTFPVAAHRQRHATRLAEAHDAWPRLMEELRLLTGSLGRSIPQALFEVGTRGPAGLRPAFDAAQREWLLSTDFARTVAVLKAQLAEPTADAICETLLVAHELGGADLDRRLEALIEDRVQDAQARKDARARQAGVRFARRFVLIVPIGMALAGMSVGNGRQAYQSPAGQSAVVIALVLVALCWIWAGRMLRLPAPERVFAA